MSVNSVSRQTCATSIARQPPSFHKPGQPGESLDTRTHSGVLPRHQPVSRGRGFRAQSGGLESRLLDVGSPQGSPEYSSRSLCRVCDPEWLTDEWFHCEWYSETCFDRPLLWEWPVLDMLKDDIFLAEGPTFQYSWTCHQSPPVLKSPYF